MPRRCERFEASTSEPLIWLATSWRSRPALRELVWISCCTAPTELESCAHEHDVDEAVLAGELLELGEREVDVGALAAERRLHEADDVNSCR